MDLSAAIRGAAERLVCISAPMASGKTHLLHQMLKALDEDMWVIIITFRESLSRYLAARLSEGTPESKVRHALHAAP